MTIPGRHLVFRLGNRVRCNTEYLGSDAGSGYLRAGAFDSLGASTGYRAEEQQFGSMGLPVVVSAGTQLAPIKHCRTCNRCCCRYE